MRLIGALLSRGAIIIGVRPTAPRPPEIGAVSAIPASLNKRALRERPVLPRSTVRFPIIASAWRLIQYPRCVPNSARLIVIDATAIIKVVGLDRPPDLACRLA